MVVQLVVGGDGVQLHLCETKWVVRQGKGNNLLGEWTKISIAFNKQGVEVEIGFLRGGGDNLLCRGGGRSIENPVLEVQEGGVSAPEDLQQPQSLVVGDRWQNSRDLLPFGALQSSKVGSGRVCGVSSSSPSPSLMRWWSRHSLTRQEEVGWLSLRSQFVDWLLVQPHRPPAPPSWPGWWQSPCWWRYCRHEGKRWHLWHQWLGQPHLHHSYLEEN